MSKSSTTKIALFEPDQAQLKSALQDRELSPSLIEFLTNLLRTKKWTRKINIPSGHADVAAVLVFTTALMESGFEIYSELHVFFAGKVRVEKWQVVGEKEQISLLPKEVFNAIDVNKVRVENGHVFVEISAPTIGGNSGVLIKTFDFTEDDLGVRFVPHPLLEENSAPLPRIVGAICILALAAVFTGCTGSREPKRPDVYRGGQDYEQAAHAQGR